MEELGRKMVAKCAGLPLAIVILGGILVTKPTTSEWEKVYHDIQSSLKKGEGLGEVHQRQLFEVLVWSYSDLPTQLKPCFLYIGKFGEDEWVSTKKLYQLWIAEGMVLSSDRREGETMMQVAESYLGELVHKNMVQVKSSFSVQSSLAKFESCSLHDLMRDLSHFQAKAEDFYEVIELGGGNDFYVNPDVGLKAADTQQLVVYLNEGCTRKKTITYFAKQVNELQYRSMLIFGKFPLTPLVAASDVGRFKLLRVCALEDVQLYKTSTLFNINLGGVLGGLIYLRCLSVRNISMNFPSIQKSVLLQTLRLRGDLYFPAWMSKNVLGKLKRLRHLYLPNRSVKGFIGKNSKLRFDGLSKLETLENFDTSWCEVKDLPKLTSLQRLYLIVKGSIYDLEEMIKNLSALALSSSSSSCLKELGIDIFVSDDMRLGSGPDMLRKLMSDHKYTLRDMRLRGKIPELGELFMQQEQQLNNNNNTHHHHLLLTDVSLLRITFLVLEGTYLEEDPMPYLEKIPTLSTLYLYDNAYVGNEMVCSGTGGGFPKLTQLYIWSLPSLRKWRVEEGSMPILKTLYIRGCMNLEELPEGLVFLTSLQSLEIVNMPSEFCERIREKVSNNGGKEGPEFYKVAHIPSLDIRNPH